MPGQSERLSAAVGKKLVLKMKVEYVNFALWDFVFYRVCSTAASETGNKQGIEEVWLVSLYIHISGSRETCLPPSGCS